LWGSDNSYFNKFKKASYRLGFLGRNYPHKNLKILIDVERILKFKYGFDCEFLLSLNKVEMSDLGVSKNNKFISTGPLNSTQCPAFYQSIDAVIFPSLLECFSATPLEGMIMGKPVFGSDRPFLRDSCGDNIYYIDPLCANDIAKKIVDAFSNPESMALKVIEAKAFVSSLPTASDRACKYVSIIKSCGLG